MQVMDRSKPCSDRSKLCSDRSKPCSHHFGAAMKHQQESRLWAPSHPSQCQQLRDTLTFPVPDVVQAGQGDPPGHQRHWSPAGPRVAVLQHPAARLVPSPVQEVGGLGGPRGGRVGEHIQLAHAVGQRALALLSLKGWRQRRPQQWRGGGKVTGCPAHVGAPGHGAGVCQQGCVLVHGAAGLHEVQRGLGLQ